MTSQVTPAGQSRLKRRLANGSVTTSSPQRPRIASDEFDIPLFETHEEASLKRARQDDGPQKSKKVAKKKSPAVDKKQSRKEKNGAKAAPSSKQPSTGAASQPRRAPKTPRYVDESDDGEHEARESTSLEQETNIQEKGNQEDSDIVEDSYALSKSAVEAALEASKHSFNSNLEEIVSPAPETAAESGTNEASVEIQKAADNTGNKIPLGRFKTPQRPVPSFKEPWIPPAVKEKVLRKTPIVHFGPGGPDNQAVSQKPHHKVAKSSVSKGHPRHIDPVESVPDDLGGFDQDFIDIASDTVSELRLQAEPFNDDGNVPNPPQSQGRVSLPHRRSHNVAFASPTTKQPTIERSPPKKQGGNVEIAPSRGPVRTKKSLLQTAPRPPTSPKQPPATPISFCARLETENLQLYGMKIPGSNAGASVDRHEGVHTSGDASITLLDEHPTITRQSPAFRPRRKRQHLPVSSDTSSQQDSPTCIKQTKNVVEAPVYRVEGVRESQHGLMNSILLITKASSSLTNTVELC